MKTENEETQVLNKDLKLSIDRTDKLHPWRFCPSGKHFVHTHLERIPPSKRHPSGLVISRHEHCADNPSKKDLLTFDEIIKISETYFKDLKGPPRAGVLAFDNADKYDHLIRGWTQYWNEIFHPKEPLDPDLVKALIASESGFDPGTDNKVKKKTVHAYGLMQLRENTLEYLKDHKGELRNYLVKITHKNSYDPSANICAGIRWLFRKKEIVTAELKQEATWFQAAAEYKSYLGDPDEIKKMKQFFDCYNQLKGK